MQAEQSTFRLGSASAGPGETAIGELPFAVGMDAKPVTIVYLAY